MLNKSMPAIFLRMSHLFFSGIIPQVLKVCFLWKRLKRDYLKNIRKEENWGKFLFAPWLAIYQCKQIIENSNSIDAEAHKIGKIVSLWYSFYPFFPMFWVRGNGKLYILKDLRSYYKNMSYNSTFMFFGMFFFSWKGTLENYNLGKSMIGSENGKWVSTLITQNQPMFLFIK